LASITLAAAVNLVARVIALQTGNDASADIQMTDQVVTHPMPLTGQGH